ncbi:N-terminal_acetyltransferase complex ARD1 subunit [Hexamita inflata]|uniref:N-terminal acetyltransferase complex ARD1 subunit n=1 Tax=Hexamita inflata TaxID=28002 RepID=A0AA86V336_9EUKA|nr:N-terminal acetyltransferase complex ARD1 subunit [Hexamita inflata]
MISLRRYQIGDIPQLQQINLECLPENYSLRYWETHYLQWPETTFVATVNNIVVGYIMGKVEENHGHITSVAVKQTYRGMGIATRLLRQVHKAMRDCYGVKYCTLHVRYYNDAAQHLYEIKNGYTEKEIDTAYFADGEDAWKMTCQFENLDELAVPIKKQENKVE